jgi:phosphoglycerate kinase
MLGAEVEFLPDCIGPERSRKLEALGPSDVVLLENVRYYKQENDNDEEFARALAEGVDVYINDAFGNCHRPHASMIGVPRFTREKASGLLVEQELDAVNEFLERTSHPAVAIVGGAKVAGKDGKIHVIKNLLPRVDSVCVVGKIAYYFMQAEGTAVGGTIGADDRQIDAPGSELGQTLRDCREVLAGARGKIVLPVDSVCFNPEWPDVRIVDHETEEVPGDARALDVGPAATERIIGLVREARSIVWNGPLGLFEDERFRRSSLALAKAIGESGARVLVGGGDTLAALAEASIESDRIHVCTGGGAMLTMLMGRALPAIVALEDAG